MEKATAKFTLGTTHQEMKVERQSCDRISALSQDTIEKILTLMPIRDALRTSILSRKWRTIPKLKFDDSQLVVLSDNEEINEYKFVKGMFHVLLLHRAPILEFSLSINNEYIGICSEIDQIILHLSKNSDIKKFLFENLIPETGYYPLPCSFFSLHGLEHLDLSFCIFEPPSMYKGSSKLKSLCFTNVFITNQMVLGFLANCPILVEFSWTNVDVDLNEGELVDLFTRLPCWIQLPRSQVKLPCEASKKPKSSLPLIKPLSLTKNMNT
ncbi:hypothetical protein LXL04_015136 [Taraxacum kok-saghyz]